MSDLLEPPNTPKRAGKRGVRPAWAIFLGFSWFLTGCGIFVPYIGSGHESNETRTLSGIQSVESTGVFEVQVVSGETEKAVLTGDDNLLTYVRTEVVGGVLKIEPQWGVNLLPSRTLRVQVTVKGIGGLKNTGTGAMTCEAPYTSPFSVVNTGTGAVTVKGSVAKLTASLTGTGALVAGDLTNAIVDLNSTGTGNATVRATNQLKVVLTGTGNVYYYGNPACDFQSLGTGVIRKQ